MDNRHFRMFTVFATSLRSKATQKMSRTTQNNLLIIWFHKPSELGARYAIVPVEGPSSCYFFEKRFSPIQRDNTEKLKIKKMRPPPAYSTYQFSSLMRVVGGPLNSQSAVNTCAVPLIALDFKKIDIFYYIYTYIYLFF